MTRLAAPQQAELEAALRYWESEARADQDEQARYARMRASQCRVRLDALRGDRTHGGS